MATPTFDTIEAQASYGIDTEQEESHAREI